MDKVSGLKMPDEAGWLRSDRVWGTGGVYVASDGAQHPATVIAIEHGALRPPAYRTDDDLII